MNEQAKTSKKLYEMLPKAYFILQIIVGLFAAYWVLINHQPKTGDDVEHLHSAWLVYQGKIPYLEFFQHHNPLLWYIFAPIMGLFSYDIIVFDIARTLSTLVMLLTLFMAAKIVEKYITDSKYAGLLTIAAVFPSYIVFSGQDFRPDNYMVCSFIGGLYYLLGYLKNHRTYKLVTSFFLMFITFMFMQKSIFFLGIMGLIILYLLYKKEIILKDFMLSLILPIAGILSFIGWLLANDMLEKYWLCNFTFNLYIPDVYGYLSETTKPEFYVLSALALISFCYLMIKGNTAARIICILWISEAIQRFFYFSLDRHYYYFLDILNAMLVGALAWILIKKYSVSAYAFALLSLSAMYPFYQYCAKNKLSPDYHRYVTPKYVIEQANKCDSVINGYGLTFGIFTKDLSYYWNLYGQLDVIGDKIGLEPLPDLNSLVAKNLPLIIYTNPFWNEKLHQQKQEVFVHLINSTLRDTYYEQSIFVGLFILKPEYRYTSKRRCRYDAKTDTWNYYYYDKE